MVIGLCRLIGLPPRMKNDRLGSRPQSNIGLARPLAPSLLHLGTALADFELGVALANHVNTPTSFDDLAIWVAVFQRANATDNFHRIDLVRLIVYVNCRPEPLWSDDSSREV
jgi:hypothetical protein